MTIYACIDPGGNVRVVNDPNECCDREQQLKWEEVGPPGQQGQQGLAGAEGPAGEAAEVPSGAVMFFDREACPVGWTELTAAHGRVLVGAYPEGEHGAQVGSALGDGSPRAHVHAVPSASTSREGSHSHYIPHSSGPFLTEESGSHRHTLTETPQVIEAPRGTNVDGVGVAGGNHEHEDQSERGLHQHQIIIHLLSLVSDGAHAHEVELADSDVRHARTMDVIPYMQLLVCRKD